MPRAFMDSTGFKVAAPGYDAKTASELNLMLSSSSSSLTLYQTGIVSLNQTDELYKYGQVNFGKTFAQPPIVFFGLIMPSGRVNGNIFGMMPGSGFFYTRLYCRTTTTFCRIYKYQDDDGTTARYYIMENTIQ